MNSKVIHESERAGGMGGAPRTRLRRAKACKSWCEMVHISWDIQLSSNSHLGVTGWFSYHWKFNCWVFWVFWIRTSPQKMEPNGSVLQPAEIFFIFCKKDPRHPVTGFKWWYGMTWNGMVWYEVEWYGMRWYGMVWCGMVWYWYGVSIPWYHGIGMEDIPLWNGVPSRFANSKNWISS